MCVRQSSLIVEHIQSLPTHVAQVQWKIARRIIESHHYLQYAPPGCKFSLGVFSGRQLLGVLIFGRPAARNEDQDNTLELTRMFLFDSPKNSESRALSLAEKWIRKNRSESRMIAYSDTTEGHMGTIYRAANWKCIGNTRLDDSWSKSRPGRRGCIGGRKLKFERIIKINKR